jgi:hypothetical protein
MGTGIFVPPGNVPARKKIRFIAEGAERASPGLLCSFADQAKGRAAQPDQIGDGNARGGRLTEAPLLPPADKLFLCTAKTGTPVYCPLPPFVIEALDAIPESTYFFWTGLSTPKTAAGIGRESLKRLFVLAGIPDGHTHRFRDTFSVELLLAGVPIERVSIILGHQSVRITEKHYAPWVRARQEQLEADVRRTWETPEPQWRVHGGYTKKAGACNCFQIKK